MPQYPHLDEGAPENERDWFEALVRLARYLRGPDGCPWDRKQTSRDFARFMKEEAEELQEAYAVDDDSAVEEEWGDTFFCMLAAAAAAEQEGRFTLEQALRRTHEKMVRRHGHIFGDHDAETPEEVVEVWHTIKAKEKGEPRS